ncbi:hypothetical protein RJ640_018974 [Escallonia rubra]|uniref:Late embryogenesis abundant protein LEA-2 subgroup domain-containing protein n=1 Tax=Escallonia rubra TaxID=112253 RepID=A0AA88RSA7_9ASTE|nr:hypothetical protein RJ640_018974 [Escallonia rubra]
MAEENQNTPLAPPGIYQRSDEESATTTMKPGGSRHKKSNKCVVYFLAAVVVQSAFMLIFASIVFRVTKPDVKLRSVEIKDLQSGTPQSPSLNMTMLAEVTVQNKNFGRFEYYNSVVSVWFGNVTISDRSIDGGRVKSRKTNVIDVAVAVRADGQLLSESDRNISTDFSKELVQLSIGAELRGKVHVMKILKKSIRAQLMNCTMNLNLTSKAIQDLLCR